MRAVQSFQWPRCTCGYDLRALLVRASRNHIKMGFVFLAVGLGGLLVDGNLAFDVVGLLGGVACLIKGAMERRILQKQEPTTI